LRVERRRMRRMEKLGRMKEMSEEEEGGGGRRRP